MSSIVPYDGNTPQYIPEDPSSRINQPAVPAAHIQTTEYSIGSFVDGLNVLPKFMAPVDQAVNASDINIIGNSGVDANASVELSISGTFGSVTVNEGQTATFEVTANLNGSSYQWQKQESGTTTWSDISGATSTSYVTPVLSFANDNGDKYRVIVTNADASNSPVTSDEFTLVVKRVITITVQPTVATSYAVGTTATFSVTATISSGSAATLQYQWQKQEFGTTAFNSVTVSGNTSSYTTPTLATILDNGDTYRCVVSHPDANSVISNTVTLVVTGADYQVTPAINGISFWRLSVDGPLILDPAYGTEFTIRSLEPARTRIYSKMWGQGSCSGQGGYTQGSIPTTQLQTFTIKLNAGAGTGGTFPNATNGNNGGGYAGIFNGTTVSQATALLIAGGAGGGGITSSGSCALTGGAGGGPGGTGQQYNGPTDSAGPFTATSVNSNPACPGGPNYGWYTRTGGATTDPSSDVRQLVIKWDGAVIYNGSMPFNIRTPYIVVGDYLYFAGTHRGTQYGWNGDGTSCGTASTPLGDFANAFDIRRQGIGNSLSGSNTTSGTIFLQSQNRGTNGSALQGGNGATSTDLGACIAPIGGGGGGGGGYVGGGGGAAAGSAAGAGGGGSGFVAATVSGTTSAFSNSTDANRSNAGSVNGPSRLVIEQTNITITQQPISVIAASGTSPTISVTASILNVPTEVIQYQWQKKESGTSVWNNISGANSSSYIISSLSAADTGDFYRCILSNPHSITVTSNEVDVTVIVPGAVTETVVYRTAGNANFTVPNNVEKIRFYMWGAGGEGTGECVSSSGGSGGYLSGVIDITDGDVFLARVGSTDNGSESGQAGFGAGRGGGWTGLFKYVSGTPELVAIAGGGGGAGQASSGGGGGGNGSGGSGAGGCAGGGGSQSSGGSGACGGSSGSFYTTGGSSGFASGGTSGGTAVGTSRRGGGGGGGYYGGGGGGADVNNNCTGHGGGGGSGYINTARLGPSDTTFVSSAGSQGASGGVNPTVTGTPWNTFVSSAGGYQAGRSGQAGLIIFEITYRFDFVVSPAVAGKTNWNLVSDGPLILDGGSSTTYTLTALKSLGRTVKMWGEGTAATGGYSTGTVNFVSGNTYTVRLNAGRGSGGTGSGWPGNGSNGGGYAGLFNGTSITQGNAIMIAGGSGANGGYSCDNSSGGTGGGSSGGTGCSSNDSQIGSTGGGGGTQSSGGGGGGGGGQSGSALQGGTGGSGQVGGFPNAGGGGGGGGGYFGGGGGGGGNDFGGGTRRSSGGGGGSGYINTSVVTGGSTSGFANSGDASRGNAGSPGYSSRVVITT